MKNRSGEKIGKLTYIKVSDIRSNNGDILWEMLCDCGNIITKNPRNLRKGSNCGCLYQTYIKNKQGTKIGMWTLVNPSEIHNTNGHKLWHVICDCGTVAIKDISQTAFKKTKNSNCGCAAGQLNRVYDPWTSSGRAVWQQRYKECPFDTFLKLSQQNCHYCNSPPTNCYNRGTSKTRVSKLQLEFGNFVHNGIDRIDSTKSHTPDNIVPCCQNCNRAKSNMSITDFLNLIERMQYALRLR